MGPTILNRLGSWRAALRDPVVLAGFLVDLLPLWAVIFWGWGAASLVMLFWLENVVLGGVTIARVLLASIGKRGWTGIIGGAWLSALFCLHYGLFCFAHGGILTEVMGGDMAWQSGDSLRDVLLGVVQSALGFGRNMIWMLALLAAWHGLIFLREFVGRGEWRTANPDNEMFRPYGRVIALHIGMFVVAAALEYLGDPGVGALALVLARAAWGVNLKAAKSTPDVSPLVA